MSSGSAELYELFLALAPARIAAAERALREYEGQERWLEIEGALIPLAVDAALLGAEGVSSLASAIAQARHAKPEELLAAVGELSRAATELGHGDASGARTDEAALMEFAKTLRQRQPPPEPQAQPIQALPTSSQALETPDEQGPVTKRASSPAPPPPASGDRELSEVEHWDPSLQSDMVGAFLDECAERTEGLAGRLLELEEHGDDQDLVDEIFRDLHTLKGSSAFAGLRKLNRVAHVAEDLIGELRSGRRRVDRTLVDLLLETLDVLKEIVDRAREGQPIDLDVTDLVARLRDPSRSPSLPARGPDTPTSIPAEAVLSAAATTAANAAPRKATTRRPRAGGGTLRIDFEKVDLLLNLVGEIVLSRGRLSATHEAQSALLRELVQFRKRLGGSTATFESTGTDNLVAVPTVGEATRLLVEDFQRIERVLRDTHSELDASLGGLALAGGQLRDTVMKLRMVPIAQLFSKYQRTVRELSHKLEKNVHVELSGEDTELDKVLVERLEDPLLHLVRNAVDHGIETPAERLRAGKPETGRLRLTANHRGGQILVSIEDDGAGMNAERLKKKAVDKGILDEKSAQELSDDQAYELIFQPGFSTAARVSDVSGRGVGMDVVKNAITRLKGNVTLRSSVGKGTLVELRLPLTLAITQVLTVRVGGELVALPLDAVMSAQALHENDLEQVADSACLRIAGELVPVVNLATILGFERETLLTHADEASVIITHAGAERLGLVVEQVLGRQEVVIKSLGPLLAKTPCAAGATQIGDRIALVVDLGSVAERARRRGTQGDAIPVRARATRRAHILIAEDSTVVRETMQRELQRAGFEVSTAEDGEAALELAQTKLFDAVCTDVMMPKMDGYQLTRALRRLPQYKSVPIAMVTSKNARIDSMRGYDAGANVYLTKPTDASALIRQLDALLQLDASLGDHQGEK